MNCLICYFLSLVELSLFGKTMTIVVDWVPRVHNV